MHKAHNYNMKYFMNSCYLPFSLSLSVLTRASVVVCGHITKGHFLLLFAHLLIKILMFMTRL